jgi:hypothetical protein
VVCFFFFFEFLTSLYFGVVNFFKSTLSLIIFSLSDAPIARVQVLFEHQKQ